MTRIILLAGAGALALTACAPTAESVQGPDQNRFAQGAAAGAVAGAALAAIGPAENDNERILAGAAIGAAIGAGIGGTLDQQEEALRRELRDGRIGIVNTGQDLRVTFPAELLFAVDSDVVPPSSQADLLRLANNLQQYPRTLVSIVGHADNTGTTAYNQDLSERRARSVAQILRAGGVGQRRLRVAGAGELQPIATNATAEGRAQNRRVEIIIVPVRQGG